MRIARVIGTVTLSQAHPSLRGGRLKLAVPLSLDEVANDEIGMAEDLVVYDELGAGLGGMIMLSEGAEAAQPFYPEIKPVDAYNAGMLDTVQLAANPRMPNARKPNE
jgi:ethanolamine utilization protein EutN